MTTVKQALIRVGKNTHQMFHIGANYQEQSSALDIVSLEGGFGITIDTPTSSKRRTFEKFSQLCDFVAKENLLKIRCFIRFF